jgi:hypothetical protein
LISQLLQVFAETVSFPGWFARTTGSLLSEKNLLVRSLYSKKKLEYEISGSHSSEYEV